MKTALDAAQVYSPQQVLQVVELFLTGADRDKLDPILDACVAVYLNSLDEDGQADFKGKAVVLGTHEETGSYGYNYVSTPRKVKK